MKYVQVVQWSVEGDSIRFEMFGEDQNTHHFEVSAACAGALAAALTAEVQKLDVQSEDHQLIRPTGVQTGKTDKGEPMLFMTLKGGAELPLVFGLDSLGVLISELENLRKHIGADSQVRWR